MTLKCDFQYTFDEFKEASGALQKRAQKSVSRNFGRWTFIFALLVGVAIMLVVFLNRTSQSTGTPAAPTSQNQNLALEVLVPVLPWLLIFGFVWFFVYRQLRNRYQSAWDKHPDLHRPHVLEIDDEGLSWSTQVSNSRRLWEGYTSWDETKNLFLLYRGELLVEFIPKRAIADVASFDQVRELLRRSISPPQHAFPVIR